MMKTETASPVPDIRVADDTDDEGTAHNSNLGDDEMSIANRSPSVVKLGSPSPIHMQDILDTPSPIRLQDCSGIDRSPMTFCIGTVTTRHDTPVMVKAATADRNSDDQPRASSSNIAGNTPDDEIPSFWTKMIRQFEHGTRELKENVDSPNKQDINKPLLANGIVEGGTIGQGHGEISDKGVAAVAALSKSSTPSTLASATLDGCVVPVGVADAVRIETAQEQSQSLDIFTERMGCALASTTVVVTAPWTNMDPRTITPPRQAGRKAFPSAVSPNIDAIASSPLSSAPSSSSGNLCDSRIDSQKRPFEGGTSPVEESNEIDLLASIKHPGNARIRAIAPNLKDGPGEADWTAVYSGFLELVGLWEVTNVSSR